MNGNEKQAVEPETYPLDDAFMALVAEFRQHQTMLQGALVLFLRQHSLSGNWTIAENGREVIQMPAPAIAQR